jgi:hypothetical protein
MLFFNGNSDMSPRKREKKLIFEMPFRIETPRSLGQYHQSQYHRLNQGVGFNFVVPCHN